MGGRRPFQQGSSMSKGSRNQCSQLGERRWSYCSGGTHQRLTLPAWRAALSRCLYPFPISVSFQTWPTSFCFLSWTRCRARPEGPGDGAYPANEAERAAEVFWRSLPAGHGAVPFHRLPADSGEARQVTGWGVASWVCGDGVSCIPQVEHGIKSPQIRASVSYLPCHCFCLYL